MTKLSESKDCDAVCDSKRGQYLDRLVRLLSYWEDSNTLELIVNCIDSLECSNVTAEDMLRYVNQFIKNNEIWMQNKFKILGKALNTIDTRNQNLLDAVLGGMLSLPDINGKGKFRAYWNLSPHKQSIFQKQFNPHILDRKNQEYNEFGDGCGGYDEEKIKEKEKSIKSTIKKLCPGCGFDSNSNIHADYLSAHLIIKPDSLSNQIQQRNSMPKDKQGELLAILDKTFLKNKGDSKYRVFYVVDNLYESESESGSNPKYKDFFFPELIRGSEDNNFNRQRLEVQYLTIAFSTIMWYANKKNLKLSLSGSYAGLYS